MTQHHVYVPIIKGKRNDIQAVGMLRDEVRSLVKPLVEAMPVNRAKSSVEDHIQKFVRYIVKHIPSGEIFVDFFGLMPDEKLEDGSDATITGFELLQSLGRSVTPTYGLARNDELWASLGPIVEGFGKGFCFRLSIDDLDDNAEESWTQVIERSSDLGLAPRQVDLVIDLRFVGNHDESQLNELVVDFVALNPQASTYRSIVVAGSSAMKTVGEIEKDDVGEVVRRELYVWSTLRRDVDDSLQLLFGDYGVIHPDFSDFGSSKYMNAKIRYTAGDRIIYYRGHGLIYPKKDYAQYHNLARKACSDPRFRGASASFGDSYLYQCSNRLIKPGTPSTWVRADMNRHISYTAPQVERLMSLFSRNRSESAARRALQAN